LLPQLNYYGFCFENSAKGYATILPISTPFEINSIPFPGYSQKLKYRKLLEELLQAHGYWS